MQAAPARAFSASASLVDRLADLVPVKQAEVKEVKAKYGDKSLGEVTVGQVSAQTGRALSDV